MHYLCVDAGFVWRLRFKYLYRDFHPLFFFYTFALIFLPIGALTGLAMLFNKLFGDGTAITGPRSVLCALMLMLGWMFLLFAMLFDMEESK